MFQLSGIPYRVFYGFSLVLGAFELCPQRLQNPLLKEYTL